MSLQGRGRDTDTEMAEGAIFFLLEKVVSFLEEEANLQSELRADVEEIRRSLKKMEAFLRDAEGKEQISASLKNLVKEVQEVAYEIDDVLDKFMLCVPQQSHGHGFLDRLHTKAHIVRHRGTYHEISSDIKAKKDKIRNILTDASNHFNSLHQGSSSTDSSEDPRLSYPVIEEDEIVGITNAKKELIHLLTNGESRRTVISVVGTGGLGKTTLVKKVYESRSVTKNFIIHAWINGSPSSNAKELLKRLLQKLFEDWREAVPQGIDTMETSTLIVEVKNFLQRARYVVVLDDVWSIDVWESMKHAIPNNDDGSRVILITRNRDVASTCVRSLSHMHNLQPLDYNDAWKLFCIKAFRSRDVGCCPLDLSKLSQEIVQNCEGLPLAVAHIGGLLSRADKTQREWNKLHQGLGYELENNNSLTCITSALLLSYNNLPYHLKSCFLYFAVFPHDYPIKCTRLIRLWIAEGFVRKRESKTLEEVADDYLNKLMCASLIEVADKDFDGRARSYRVHHIMHKIILSKAKEENFSIVFSRENTNVQEKIWRLLIQENTQNIRQNASFSYTRSLFMSWKTDLSGSSMDVLLSSFNSLKVLDLQDAPIKEFPNVTLAQLRYLSLRNTKIRELPKSLGHSRNLETLDLKQTYVVELPNEILKLERLRHLLVYRYNNVNRYVFFGCVQGLKVSTGIQHLSSLQKLSLIKTKGGRSIIKELGKLTELRKLGLVELKRQDGKYLCFSIQEMKNLLTLDVTSKQMEEVLDLHDMDSMKLPRLLQCLYLKGRLEKFPNWISSLRDLARIGLMWSRLKDNPLQALQALPNLIELKLTDAYTGQELVFGAGGFQRLEILELDLFEQLNMVTVQDNTMPRLQKLTMSRCENLKMAPVGIFYLKQLKELQLYDMPKELVFRLQKNGGDDRCIVDHIPNICSSSLQSNGSWSLTDLS